MNSRLKNALFYKIMLGVTFVSLSPAFSTNGSEDLDSSCPEQIHFQKPEEILTYAPATQWSKLYDVSDDPNAQDGHQVLHFNANKRKHFSEDKSGFAQKFIKKYCQSAKIFQTDADTLAFASATAKFARNNDLKEDQFDDDDNKNFKGRTPFIGEIVELGTGAAKTTNGLAYSNPKKLIYSFDDFDKGLPEEWVKELGVRSIPQGAFARKVPGYLPNVLHNVRIIEGSFDEKLPLFKKQILKNTPISLLNVDCDVYTSTKTAFDVLGDNIVPGTIIYFDELYNYPNYKEGEWKAFKEYIKKTNYKFKVIAVNEYHEQAVIRILPRT